MLGLATRCLHLAMVTNPLTIANELVVSFTFLVFSVVLTKWKTD